MKLLSLKITINQALATGVIGVFLFIATFSLAFGVQVDEHGNMSNCPFTSGQTAVCPMGITEHIARWQQLFIMASPESNVFASLIFMSLTFIFLTLVIRVLNFSSPKLALSPPVTKNKRETKLFDQFVKAFSQGIIHPRLYA